MGHCLRAENITKSPYAIPRHLTFQRYDTTAYQAEAAMSVLPERYRTLILTEHMVQSIKFSRIKISSAESLHTP